MRRRIEQLLNGNFEYEVAPLLLSPERVEGSAGENSVFAGSFDVQTADERKSRCFIYASNARVLLDPVTLYGSKARVDFRVNLRGLEPGDRVEGVFTVCSDRGEYELPFRFSVLRSGQKEQEEELSMLPEDLAAAAREDYRHACSILESEAFERGLKKADAEAWLVYDALRSQKGMQRLEEFLIGTGVKAPVGFTLDSEGTAMARPAQSVSQSFVIERDNWGYQEITISSDARFLRPERRMITTEAFVGDRCVVEYIVDTNFLHAGKNYGRITVSSCYQTLNYEVVVNAQRRTETTRSARVQKMMRRKLLSLYLDMRLRRIETQSWAERSANVISSYKRAGGRDLFADLLQAQLYYAEGKKTRARHILREAEKNPDRFETPEQYAFYLYLSTFFEDDAARVDQVEARIEQLFLRNRSSWIIQWTLLYLQERYLKDESARLQAVMTQVREGCASPVMYLEAGQILARNPYLLRELTRPWCRVLLFMVKNRMMTEELACQTGSLAEHGGTYDPVLFRILEGCYELTGDTGILKAICVILIEADKKDRSFFRWYELGVDRELRINGLYEYYMETMDTVGIEKMPQVIRMYFSYSSSLNYHKKAAIYRDISDNRDNVPQVYRGSRPGIEQFVMQQLSLERIDKNLAVLYERFISRKLLGESQAEHLAKLLFTFRISCRNPKMKQVVIVYPNLKQEQTVLLQKGSAKTAIYSGSARIFLEDGEGNRYAASSLYQAERYLDSPMLISWCRELVPTHPGLVLFMCSGMDRVTKENLPFACQAEQMDELRSSFRMQLRRKILDYYRRNPQQDELYGYLKQLNAADFIKADKTALISLMTQEGMYEQAFDLIRGYGEENVPPSDLVRICSQTVLALEFDEDTDLVRTCYDCYRFGKYNDHILNYLLMYYDGPVEDMKRLWNTGRQYELDTMALEEKILSMILFCRNGSAGSEQIFASYFRRLGRRKICRAYLNLKAYEYFVRNLPVNDLIFGCIEQDLRNGSEMEDVCSLALLQYYSRMPQLDKERTKTVSQLLGMYNRKNMRFGFYRQFPREIRLPLQIEDRVFLEYVANPSHTVILRYRRAGEEAWQEEPMRNVFEGIFVREFILFEGERMECCMRELENDEVVQTTEPRILTCDDRDRVKGSRFALLCEMEKARGGGDGQGLRAAMDTFLQMDYVTGEIFTLV